MKTVLYDYNEDNEHLKNPVQSFFLTNSTSFTLYFNIDDIVRGHFPQVGITARQGIMILYRTKEHKNWTNINQFARKNEITIDMSKYIQEGTFYEIMIYGPILSKLSSLSVEIEEGYELISSHSYDGQLLILGGLQSFGIGCTTTGLMFSNIIGRKLNYSVNHITFNNRNYLNLIDKTLKEKSLNHVKYSILEVDYGNQIDIEIDEYLKEIIIQLKKFSENIICWYTLSPNKNYKKKNIENILNEFNDDENIKILDMSCLYSQKYEDMCTSSNYYVNDGGNILIFKKIFELIKEIE